MTHRDGSQGFRPGARGVAMRDIGSHARRRPTALGNRRSGRAGEPPAGESVGASESLDDPSSAAAALPLRRVDVPHRPRLSCYPADRLPDLYGSLSTLLGITPASDVLAPMSALHPRALGRHHAGLGHPRVQPRPFRGFVVPGRGAHDRDPVHRLRRPRAHRDAG